MDVESLRYIVTLSEELHFGRSASRHYIGEVQFGRRVRQIESELGVQVFQRTSRRVMVTPEGRGVVIQACRALGSWMSCGDRVHAYSSDTTRVGVLGFGVGDRWSLIRDLVVAACPGQRFVHRPLTLADQHAALLRGEVDVALVHYLGDVDGLDLQLVMSTPRVAVVPASSPLAHASQITVEHGDGQQWLRLRSGDERFTAWAGPYAKRSAGPQISTLDTVPIAVATTALLGIHGAAAAQFYAHPDVRFIPMAGEPISTAVATRANDDRADVQAFRAAARFVADMRVDV